MRGPLGASSRGNSASHLTVGESESGHRFFVGNLSYHYSDALEPNGIPEFVDDVVGEGTSVLEFSVENFQTTRSTHIRTSFGCRSKYRLKCQIRLAVARFYLENRSGRRPHGRLWRDQKMQWVFDLQSAEMRNTDQGKARLPLRTARHASHQPFRHGDKP